MSVYNCFHEYGNTFSVLNALYKLCKYLSDCSLSLNQLSVVELLTSISYPAAVSQRRVLT